MRNIILIISILNSFICLAQQPVWNGTPRAPLDIPLLVSGNFMELRSDHFHSGVDLKTNGVEGLPVRVVADGRVSRVKMSPWGYGIAVYVDHAGGLTTVYGHLRSLAPALAQQVLEAQYKAQDYSVDLTPPAVDLQVAAGDQIGLSGNTGGSSAPHLHYEVRRTADQHALDPEAFGLELTDTRAPVVHGLRIYALDSTARYSPYPGKAKGFAAEVGPGGYRLRPGAEPAAIGPIGLAVHAVDHYDGSSNVCGVRSITLDVDGQRHFSAHLDEVDFALQRYVNAHMDHALFRADDMHYHRCYRQPNDRSILYEGQGVFVPTPGRVHHCVITVTDANGNRSELRFDLRGATAEEARTWPGRPAGVNMFHWDRENVLVQPGLRFTLPANALYDDEPIVYSRADTPVKSLSPLHQVLSELVPLHVQAEVSVQADVPPALEAKAVVVRHDRKGRVASLGGRWNGGWVSARTKSFGGFHVQVDTVPPTLQPLDLRADMRGRDGFRFKVQDDLSGVDKWNATLDGRWILLVYDPKAKTLTHHFDRYSEGTGTRTLVVEVTDERGNRRRSTHQFQR
ncbi:MAG: hypothetical protein GFGODING_01883 [Flavobacteriales bacterium]|nr:hypothetical protein [Flavobacteriales bacterium]